MDALSLGLKIVDFGALHGWNVFEVDENIPLSLQSRCPAGCAELNVVATLVGNQGRQQIRVGYCSGCGYVGYIDRPTREWIRQFYIHRWDSGISKDVPAAVLKFREKIPSRDIQKGMRIARILKRFGVDTNRTICEIGCGYGGVLQWLRQHGFRNVVGVENSSHRGAVGRNAYGIEILEGAFESPSLQDKLTSRVPFGFIYSFHVLEHTYDPFEVIQQIAGLQEENDLLVFALPNAESEPTPTKFLFFPHLHSFTKDSLVRLLNSNSYTVVDDSATTAEEIFLVAKKTGIRLEPRSAPTAWRFDTVLHQCISGLDLKDVRRGRSSTLFFYKALTDRGRQVPYGRSSLLTAVYAFCVPYVAMFFDRKGRKPVLRSLVLEPLTTRYTDSAYSPIEIQFSGNIKLLYK